MPRPKGSKNKPKAAKVATDFAAAIAEKTAEKEQLEQNCKNRTLSDTCTEF